MLLGRKTSKQTKWTRVCVINLAWSKCKVILMRPHFIAKVGFISLPKWVCFIAQVDCFTTEVPLFHYWSAFVSLCKWTVSSLKCHCFITEVGLLHCWSVDEVVSLPKFFIIKMGLFYYGSRLCSLPSGFLLLLKCVFFITKVGLFHYQSGFASLLKWHSVRRCEVQEPNWLSSSDSLICSDSLVTSFWWGSKPGQVKPVT